MKALRLTLSLLFLGLSLSHAQVVITSLSRQGEMTWTNSVSNATYRVEWASTAAGPWQSFDSLTNLSALRATNSMVTVAVPMFYRVVWVDSPVGTWDYTAFEGGLPIVHGELVFGNGTPPLKGTYRFEKIDYYEATTHKIGTGKFTQKTVPGTKLFLDLTAPFTFDDSFELYGEMKDNEYRGQWTATGIAGVMGTGTFIARRVP